MKIFYYHRLCSKDEQCVHLEYVAVSPRACDAVGARRMIADGELVPTNKARCVGEFINELHSRFGKAGTGTLARISARRSELETNTFVKTA